MVNDILRKKVRGRRLAPALNWDGLRGKNAFNELHKVKRVGDMPIPKGYRHTSIATIPERHRSNRLVQDQQEERAVKRIRATPPGPRRDFYIRDLEVWRQQGRPTYMDQTLGNKATPKKHAEMRRTDHDGSPVLRDIQNDRRLLKKITRERY